ncbi:MAG: hypothetical protein IT236_16795, partial [Bacteroidia bacterium]|nr:hypothetical protein [Bacteroidia bacterium]
MPKQNKLVVLILILLGSIFNLKSQISVSPSVGCSPALLGVNFQYNGSATNLTNIVWNFGDGSPTSNSLTPVHNYIGTGTFVVTFNATGLPTYTALVIVHPSPVASFNYIVPTNHCAPVAGVFNGSSSVPNSIFNWVYGDGGLGSGANNTYSYTIPGSFSAILTVSDVLTGCTGTVSHGPINVSAQPNVLINTFPGTYTCSAPFTVAFTASNSTSGSPLGGGLTYNWSFGNTQTSGAITPGPITYNSQGVYTVSLIATDNNSCSKTSSLLVSVLTPTVNAIVPPTVCINTQVNPLQPFPPWFGATVQSNVSSTTWQMGDGNVKIFPSPAMSPTYALNPNIPFSDTIHFYTTPGLKTLTITASVGACVATVTKTIFVEMITPNFTVVPSSFVCNPSLIVTYSNQTTINNGNPISYYWVATHWNNVFANSYTSTATNPTFTFVQGSLSQYVLYNAFTPTVSLFVTSAPLGCQTNIWHVIDKIQRPTAWFKVDKSEGCAPLTVTFRDSSSTYSPLFPIVSYTWNNGATGANSMVVSGTGSIIPNFVFNYTATGTYSPFLSIQTASGCASTSYIGTITVVNPVPISYTLPPPTVCAGTPVTLTMSAVPGGTVQHWHAQSDNGYFSGCVNDSTPTWFFTHLGVHSFTLSAYKNSCLSSVVVPNAITVRGPIGKVRYETNCVNPKQVKFYYHLQDATSATLSYGDNTPTLSIAGAANTSVGGFANHTYTATGDFTATLRSFNPGNACPVFTHTMLVTVRQLSVDFALDTIMCKGVFSQVTVTTSQDVLFGCGRGYSWNYDNTGTEVTTGSLFVSGTTFSAVGAHSLTLKVKDSNGCTLSLTKPFRVSAPVPTFTFNSNPICVSNYPAQMINQTPQLPDVVNSYTWVMCEGWPFNLPSTTITANNNSAFSPTFNFPTGSAVTLTFSVLLKAKSVEGCIDSTRNTIRVNDPQAFFYPTVSGACFPPAPKVNFIIS